jgi:hypothetical protein
LCYSPVLAGICSPIPAGDSPAGGCLASGSPDGSHSGKALEGEHCFSMFFPY